MLAEFIAANREVILERARARVAARQRPKPNAEELANGIPIFLDQLGDALRRVGHTEEGSHQQLRATAGRHGGDLLRIGVTVAQVVQDYGDVCQVITELAIEQRASIGADEYKILNLCLDDATSQAVTEFARLRERSIQAEGTERLGALAHELRNALNVASLAFAAIKNGRVAVRGSTSATLERNLLSMRDLIDRSLTDVRLDAGVEHRESIQVLALVEDVEVGAVLQTQARGLTLTVATVDPSLHVEGDRPTLAATLSNLLHNAFKFTHEHGHVILRACARDDRVLFEVEDECGGLPPGAAEGLFQPFSQHGSDRTGVGLGLAICMKAAKANGGELSVRDLPGKGCIFTLDLPRKAPPPLALIEGGKTGEVSKVTPSKAGTGD